MNDLSVETQEHYYSALDWVNELRDFRSLVNEEVEENLGTA